MTTSFLNEETILKTIKDNVKDTKFNQSIIEFLEKRASLRISFDNIFSYGTLVKVEQELCQETKSAAKQEKIHNFFDEVRGLLEPHLVQSVGDFKLGDKIYHIRHRDEDPVVITEFYNDKIIIDELGKPIPLALLTKQKKDNEGTIQEEHEWNNIVDKNVITSDFEFIYEDILVGKINLSPFYQRDIVWTEAQKKAYIEALFHEKADIRPTFLYLDSKTEDETGFKYEVLDGKQRLTALIEFVEGEFSIFDGIHFSDLSKIDTRFLLNHKVHYTKISKWRDVPMTEQEKIHLFFEINEYGTKMSESHLTMLKEKYLK